MLTKLIPYIITTCQVLRVHLKWLWLDTISRCQRRWIRQMDSDNSGSPWKGEPAVYPHCCAGFWKRLIGTADERPAATLRWVHRLPSAVWRLCIRRRSINHSEEGQKAKVDKEMLKAKICIKAFQQCRLSSIARASQYLFWLYWWQLSPWLRELEGGKFMLLFICLTHG